ncbi:HIT family protein [Iamia majanohamensis]|uniref:HIT family protein n=1 Tax=Iamia majanohamensis TaxID=467976 RepID=A0AAE9Y9S0_9ACTN|nr:HIT family protein [Iamia majanohamensis]WCO65042.1 HIT family protein [Iamia majanohamensis]
MPTLFTRIIEGEIPGRFVWRDERCVAFLTIAPLAPGHVLVVPVEEVDHWIDLDPDLLTHLMGVARTIARVQQDVFDPSRVGVIVAGEEVPHAHVHLIPFRSIAQLDFANAETDPDPADLDDAAERLRRGLRAAGADGVAD